MSIVELNRVLTYYVTTDNPNYPAYRTDETGTNWEVLRGEEWGPVYNTGELTEMFRDYKQTQPPQEITREELLELVDVMYCPHTEGWYVEAVKGGCGRVVGNCGSVEGTLFGTINGRQWEYVETPRQKLKRLMDEGASKEELQAALDQLEDI